MAKAYKTSSFALLNHAPMKTIPVVISLAVALVLNSSSYSQVQKRTILEIATGTWAGFSPDIETFRNEVQANNPNAIILELHNNDAMSFPGGQSIVSAIGPSYPSGLVDRYKFPTEFDMIIDRQDWQPLIDDREDMSAIAEVELIAQTWNSVTREITATVKATFACDTTGDIRLNLFIVEDSVTGSGQSYDQTNYYNTTVGHPYYQAGDPIVGYYHRNVERAFLDGAWGVSGDVSNAVSAGSSYTADYTYTLPAEYDETQIYLIPIVQRYGFSIEEREILNANIFALDTANCTNSSSIFESACNSYVSPSGNYVWETSGIYIDTVTSGLCDNILTIDLTINDSTFSVLDETALDFFVLNGVTYTESGQYTQTLTNTVGCDSIVILNLDLEHTGLATVENSTIVISPNPTRGGLTIDFGALQSNALLTIKNSLGQVVSQFDIQNSSSFNTIIEGGAGVYYAEILTDDRLSVFRIVKQ